MRISDWSSDVCSSDLREQDRAEAVCRFCDTDFVGTAGEGGGKFTSAEALADAALQFWGRAEGQRFIVLTGGEPMLQVDDALVDALHARDFEIAMESNGTLPAHRGIDWICISTKPVREVVDEWRRDAMVTGVSVTVKRSGE